MLSAYWRGYYSRLLGGRVGPEPRGDVREWRDGYAVRAAIERIPVAEKGAARRQTQRDAR